MSLQRIAAACQLVSNAHTIERSSLLYYKSERTWLYADDAVKEAFGFPESMYLYNRSNARVGHMVLLCKPRGQGNSTPSSGKMPRREMELILISEGYVSRDARHQYNYRRDLDRDICDHFESSDGDYQFYNVLGVEWLNGIAYRGGLGRGEAEALAEEPKEVTSMGRDGRCRGGNSVSGMRNTQGGQRYASCPFSCPNSQSRHSSMRIASIPLIHPSFIWFPQPHLPYLFPCIDIRNPTLFRPLLQAKTFLPRLDGCRIDRQVAPRP